MKVTRSTRNNSHGSEATPAHGEDCGCTSYLKALADETRWQIVRELLAQPFTVGELSSRLKVSEYNASKHLKILREAGIVEARKQGRHLRCQIAAAFKRRITKGKKQLDLGCCTFRF
jgi:DNA-binding transcriptional ArsR family regulator